MSAEVIARAKLNLFLELLGRRPDGYHEIDSVFAEIDLCDTLRIEPSDELSLTIEGIEAPKGPENLVWRAAAALGARARIHLVKRIPMGAGLGGGSSDAAAVLTALGGGVEPARLHAIARSLGSDVPFFLRGGTARCRGVGDLVEPIPGPTGRRFLLLVPELHMATAAVYAAAGPLLTGPRRKATVFVRRYIGEGSRAPYFNRLQGAAEGLDPRLREVREKGERMFRRIFTMTGSGAAYFAPLEAGSSSQPGLFEAGGTRVEAIEVATV
jgi:4-diphosphocytidyl-2-C-methyl-D-erythritol kinase